MVGKEECEDQAEVHNIAPFAITTSHSVLVGSTPAVEWDTPSSGRELSRPPYLPSRWNVLPVALDIFLGYELCLDHPCVTGVLQQLSEPLVSGAKRGNKDWTHSTVVQDKRRPNKGILNMPPARKREAGMEALLGECVSKIARRLYCTKYLCWPFARRKHSTKSAPPHPLGI